MLGVIQQNKNKMASLTDPQATAEAIGVAAVVVQDLSNKRNRVWLFFSFLFFGVKLIFLSLFFNFF